MVIYNVTTHVESSIEESWLNWMKEKHIPEMLATKKFKTAKIFKIINENDKGGVSYAAQYQCDNKITLEQYLNDFAAKLREDSVNKFGDRILSFRTELELIEQQP
tara:strand:+ start:608 stop:922 length:315 start_codon:yes stop_codon:yes gene_type:complete